MSPLSRLSAEQLEQIARELDAIHEQASLAACTHGRVAEASRKENAQHEWYER